MFTAVGVAKSPARDAAGRLPFSSSASARATTVRTASDCNTWADYLASSEQYMVTRLRHLLRHRLDQARPTTRLGLHRDVVQIWQTARIRQIVPPSPTCEPSRALGDRIP